MKAKEFADLILYEDSDYLAINKPYGISTLEDRVEDTHLLSMAKNQYPDIKVCHRIDKDTSGVLVFAKHPEAYRTISFQFQNRQIKKVYHAVVHGQTDFNDKKIDIPLIIKKQGIVKWDTRTGKASKTFFTTLKNFKAFSLLECKPISGRRHQIRVHLKFANHSIVSDKMYEGVDIYLSQIKKKYKAGNREEKPIISRMALHAHSITFRNMSNQEIHIEAPNPKDFEILLKQLSKYDRL